MSDTVHVYSDNVHAARQPYQPPSATPSPSTPPVPPPPPHGAPLPPRSQRHAACCLPLYIMSGLGAARAWVSERLTLYMYSLILRGDGWVDCLFENVTTNLLNLHTPILPNTCAHADLFLPTPTSHIDKLDISCLRKDWIIFRDSCRSLFLNSHPRLYEQNVKQNALSG